MHESLKFMEDNVVEGDPTKFSQIEFEKFKRVVDYMESTTYDDDKLAQGRKDFYNWFNTLDERRNTNFLETFPEMANFYNECELLNG